MRVIKRNGEVARYSKDWVRSDISNLVRATGKYTLLESYAWGNTLADVVHKKCRKLARFGRAVPVQDVQTCIRDTLEAFGITTK